MTLNNIQIKFLLVFIWITFSVNCYGDCLTAIQFDSIVAQGVEITKRNELNVDQMVFLVKIRNTMGGGDNGSTLYSEFNKYYDLIEDKIIDELKLELSGGCFYSKEFDLYLGVNVCKMRRRDMFWVEGKTC